MPWFINLSVCGCRAGFELFEIGAWPRGARIQLYICVCFAHINGLPVHIASISLPGGDDDRNELRYSKRKPTLMVTW